MDRQRSAAPAADGTGGGFALSCNLRPSCARYKQLDHDAERTLRETRHYLGDAEQILRTETTAVDFFNAKIASYPDRLARTVLWVQRPPALRRARTPRRSCRPDPRRRLALSRD